jgi:hypothetical protein
VVVRTRRGDGTVLRISPMRPTADGRRFAQLRRGDVIDRSEIVDVKVVRYEEHDILPDSDTGTYVVGDVLVRSTLFFAP